ncbi:hypothetical protein CAEBREN_18122 [Caenorhabditis brenneri]|uniref:Uncharacterized protein n=1 Tax=Caenorhabditis brenneri TaxID=135651 RepID=G0NUD0_CAEBE|nr:hypothetical protein CAEBREN_18122 [Caenorhabditis brenneri]
MEGYKNMDETVFISMEGVSEKVDDIRCTKKFLCSKCDIMTAGFFEDEQYSELTSTESCISCLRGYHSTNYPNFLSYGNKDSPIWKATIFLAGAYFQKSCLRKFLSLQFNLIVTPEILTN